MKRYTSLVACAPYKATKMEDLHARSDVSSCYIRQPVPARMRFQELLSWFRTTYRCDNRTALYYMQGFVTEQQLIEDRKHTPSPKTLDQNVVTLEMLQCDDDDEAGVVQMDRPPIVFHFLPPVPRFNCTYDHSDMCAYEYSS